MHIAIAMPTVGSTVQTKTLSSVVGTCSMLAQNRIGFTFMYVDFSEVVHARNGLARMFLDDERFTHLLFVDYDMQFSPMVVKRLLEAEKPLIGCAYPKRETDEAEIERVIRSQLAEGTFDLRRALSIASRYVVRQNPCGKTLKMRIENGLTRVQGVGMGLTLIQRRVFTDLIASGKVRHRIQTTIGGTEKKRTYGFFDPIEGDNGNLLSEDFSFCEKWRHYCCGEVWCNVADDIGHYGSYGYHGRLLDKILHLSRTSAEAGNATSEVAHEAVASAESAGTA